MSRETTRFILALIGLLLAGGIIAAMIFVRIPEQNKDVLQVTLGIVLGAALTLPFNFFFGTSQSSADKTAIIADRPSGQPRDPVHTQEEEAPLPQRHRPFPEPSFNKET